jgi:hypothetical protein
MELTRRDALTAAVLPFLSVITGMPHEKNALHFVADFIDSVTSIHA